MRACPVDRLRLQPKRCERFVVTTDSDDDGPIFLDFVRFRALDGLNQVLVAEITLGIAAGFRRNCCFRLSARHARSRCAFVTC